MEYFIHWKIQTDAKGYAYIPIRYREKVYRLLVHRVVWEEAYGQIPDDHIVHHIDGNRKNFALENLQLLSRSEHQTLHLTERHTKCWECKREVTVKTTWTDFAGGFRICVDCVKNPEIAKRYIEKYDIPAQERRKDQDYRMRHNAGYNTGLILRNSTRRPNK